MVPGCTVITYDPRMLLHEETRPPAPNKILPDILPGVPSGPHPERPQRVEAIVAHMLATGVYQRCVALPCREVTDEELATVHTQDVLTTVASKVDIPDGVVRQSHMCARIGGAPIYARLHCVVCTCSVTTLAVIRTLTSTHLWPPGCRVGAC